MASPYRLCTAGSTMQRHGLIWDELKTISKMQHILPRVQYTVVSLSSVMKGPIPEGMLKHKNIFGVWLKPVLSTASCQQCWIASAEDQEKDGTAFSHCLPLFTEQLCKIGFYVIHWDRQERHLHTVTASGGILVIAGATSQRETIPRHTSGQFLPSNYFHISCMKTNQCYQRSIGQCLLA